MPQYSLFLVVRPAQVTKQKFFKMKYFLALICVPDYVLSFLGLKCTSGLKIVALRWETVNHMLDSKTSDSRS
jgi:hypothetical protein